MKHCTAKQTLMHNSCRMFAERKQLFSFYLRYKLFEISERAVKGDRPTSAHSRVLTKLISCRYHGYYSNVTHFDEKLILPDILNFVWQAFFKPPPGSFLSANGIISSRPSTSLHRVLLLERRLRFDASFVWKLSPLADERNGFYI
jgi:hypothetical protein